MLQQTDQTKIELIGKDIAYIQKDIASINASIKELSGVYITKLQFDDLQKSLETRLVSVENNRNMWKYLTPVLTSVFTAVATYLVVFYIQNFKA